MSLDNSRPPAVAGSFYPSDRNELLAAIRACFLGKLGPGSFPGESVHGMKSKGVGCFVVPHAGYQYSGQVAAHSYSRASQLSVSAVSEKVIAIILGPNHYGVGSGIAISPSGRWATPLGKISVDKQFSARIMEECSIVESDSTAHSMEHSIEVQLPFLQSIPISKSITIVPVSIMLQDKESMEELSRAIYSVVKEFEKEGNTFLLFGSSDLTHYEPQNSAVTKDMKLLTCVESLDVLKFYSALERSNISACGYGAIAALMFIAKKLGKTRGELLKYATSGDVSGDMSSVVGYSAVQFL